MHTLKHRCVDRVWRGIRSDIAKYRSFLGSICLEQHKGKRYLIVVKYFINIYGLNVAFETQSTELLGRIARVTIK